MYTLLRTQKRAKKHAGDTATHTAPKVDGLSLIELLMTIGVIALIAAIAIPVFTNFSAAAAQQAAERQTQIITEFDAQYSALFTTGYGTGNYTGFYVAYTDTDNDGEHDPAEPVFASINLDAPVGGFLPPTLRPALAEGFATSDSSITIEWDPITTDPASEAPLSGYRVQYSTTETFTTAETVTTDADTTTYIFTSLASGTTYHFQVAGINGVGVGEYGQALSVSTLGAPTAGIALTGSATSDTTLALSWAPAVMDPTQSTPLTGYRIQYSTTPAFTDADELTTNATTTEVAITGLTVGTTYYVRGAAVNAVGTGPWGATTTLATPGAPVTAPTGLTAGDATTTTVSLSWTAAAIDPTISTAVTGYRIQYDTSSFFTSPTTINTSTTVTSTNITGLDSATTYYFRVAAVNNVGAGPWSTTATATTLVPYNAATGGTVTTHSIAGVQYKVHTFTGSGTFTVSSGAREFRVLSVGGGAGGGYGGGGGKGTLIDTTVSSLPSGGIAVTVGGGGGPMACIISNDDRSGGNGGTSSVGSFVVASGGISRGGGYGAGGWSNITGTSIQYGGQGANHQINSNDTYPGHARGGGSAASSGSSGTWYGAGGGGGQWCSGAGHSGIVQIRYQIAP
jgi:type II secretory pathway pseudopilin PulG